MSSWQRVSDHAGFFLAPNPGPMTLDGTNSYVLRAGDGPAVVVDPGPDDDAHLAALAGAGPIGLILITHHHHDHTDGAARLHALTGAPVRAVQPQHCIDAAPLADGELLSIGGLAVRVIGTPGHTSDSVCFHLPNDSGEGSVLTGDSVLGRGTTVIGVPDGTLAQYLDSLRRLAGLGRCRVLPAHGPVLDDLSAVCEQYLQHRQERLDQVREALRQLRVTAADATVAQVTDVVYRDVDPAVRFAAEHSVAAQLDYLRDVS